MPAQHSGDGAFGDGDAELFQFADDAQVAPAWVLPCQAADELDRLLRQCRSPGTPVRVGPVPLDQATVPAEERLQCDQERMPPVPRHEAGEQRHERPVRPAEGRPGHLPAQHRQLVAKHEDLGVLCQCVQTVEAEELKGAPGEAVEERQGHGQQHGTAASFLV